MRNGLPLVRQFEGCKLKAYKCPAGVWTIAYGCTKGVRPDDTCTQSQAEAWLLEEYDAFEAGVRKLVHNPTPNQLGALTSFAYNLGLGSLKSSTLLRLHNAGDYAGAAAQFLRWNKAGGRVLAGLTFRRAAESALYRV